MNKTATCLLSILFGLFIAWPVLAFPNDNSSNLLAGRIFFDTNNLNGFWYVYPGDFHRYHVGNEAEAEKILENLSFGVANDYFDKMAGYAPDRFKGRFLIKPQDAGRVYYVNPDNNSLLYIKDPQAALFWFVNLATSTEDTILKDIPTAKIITDDSGREIGREWQYLGWWGKVNANYVPVMAEPSAQAKRLGSFSKINRVKVLEIKKINGATWYQIDGGRYPGAYVESKFIDPIPQPAPDLAAVMPNTVKPGDYWIDLNISKEVLTFFKGNDPVLATYVSTGMKGSPTILGTFNVQYKYIKTRMHGGPPLATHYYDLPNVPWTMYYHGSFGVHGAYWHDEFGTPKSSGCTNATIGDAKFIFDLIRPSIGAASSVRATAADPGTVVYNHY
jgi:lipoprotein-anchoring transpeptidase ErfK/SrfK